MKNEREMAEILGKTLETYRKNKTMIPPEELEGRYKVAFSNLVEKLKNETEDLLNEITMHGFNVLKSDGEPLIQAFKDSFRANKVGRRCGKAIFEHYSMEEFYEIAREQRKRCEELYQIYVDNHVCLLATPKHFEGGEEDGLLIYNEITEEFYDTETETWGKRDVPKQQALLIRIHREGKEKMKA